MPDYLAIGDIHGMAMLLAALLPQLPREGTLVFLGDYLDRGPQSRQVIDGLISLSRERPCIFLRGNHEAMVLATLDDGNRSMEQTWFWNGGIETLESYRGRIPEDHLAFLRATRPFYTTDDYIFVHGGLRPGLHPEEMREEELWWIRDPFLTSDYDWGRRVIHGHTPTPTFTPEIRPNRINLDTGAVYGGPLTALALPEMTFYQAAAHP